MAEFCFGIALGCLEMCLMECYSSDHSRWGQSARYSVRVSGNWRLTFAWEESDASQVDLEDYH